MLLNNLIARVLLALLLSAMLGCADKPTEPELTEENVARIVAEEFAKMADTRHQGLSVLLGHKQESSPQTPTA